MTARAWEITLAARRARQDKEHPEVWHVPSSRRSATYRVQVYDGGITCTCQNGQINVRAECYHVAAVRRRLDEES